MRMFLLTRPLNSTPVYTVGDEQVQVQFALQETPQELLSKGQVSLSVLYVAADQDIPLVAKAAGDSFLELQSEYVAKVQGHPSFPLNVSRNWSDPKMVQETYAPLAGKKSLRIAVLNGMGNGYGDSIVGLSALKVLQDQLQELFLEVTFSVYSLFIGRMLPLFDASPAVAFTGCLPMPVSELLEYDAYIMLDGRNDRPEFNSQPLFDYYLDALNADKKAVPAARKRPEMNAGYFAGYAPKEPFTSLKESGKKLLFFNPFASTPVRSMPMSTARTAALELAEKSGWHVVSAAQLGVSHPNYTEVGHLTQHFAVFAACISRCDALLSVDTAAYHLSEAFGLPGRVIFTTIDPALRLAHYQYTTGALLKPEGCAIMGQHMTTRPEVVAEAVALWDGFDVMRWLPQGV